MFYLLFILTTVIHSTIYFVPDDYPTIQQAIEESVDGDSILVLPGEYSGFNYQGKNIHIESTAGPDSTVINTSIYIVSNEGREAVLKGFQISTFVDMDTYALVINGASPSILENVFKDYYWDISGAMNQLKRGMIVSLNESSALIQGNIFTNNYFYWDSYPDSPRAGDMWSSKFLGMCVYIGNQGSSNCAELRNNIFNDNTAVTYGVYMLGLCVYTNGSTILENNLFFNNGFLHGLFGSFWYCRGNALCADGGAEVTVRNCTFHHNYNYEDSGYMTALAAMGGAQLNISSSIIWANDIYDSPIIQYSDVEGGWPGTGNIDEDPCYFSGPPDYYLSPSSPCVDAGDTDPTFNDSEDPDNPGYALWPSLGGLRNDMGTYGGPGAIYWSNPGTGIDRQPSGDQSTDPFLLSVCPNPCFRSPVITFELLDSSIVKILVFDVTGRMIYQEVNYYSSGRNHMYPGNMRPGIYYARITTGEFTISRSFVVLE
ncbi:MAG: T9SS type A sorting domain-containing protein [Candidatus Aegiribacteria sp.]|nr:T9SS type A sorting domain-containing protein [Candidatus Aegiribacteria sp.]